MIGVRQRQKREPRDNRLAQDLQLALFPGSARGRVHCWSAFGVARGAVVWVVDARKRSSTSKLDQKLVFSRFSAKEEEFQQDLGHCLFVVCYLIYSPYTVTFPKVVSRQE